MTRREDFNDGYAKCIADIAREIDAIEQDGGSAERAVHNIKAIIAASTWLDDNNVAKLQAPGNVIPDVVIQDNRKGFAETVIEEGRRRAREIGTQNAEPVTREYDVTWRKPTAAYAHDVIEATSAEDALMQAKARVTSRGRFKDEPYFETDTDSMDPCDWISVEGEHDDGGDAIEHVEWEQPTPSAAVLVKALNDILVQCDPYSTMPTVNLQDIAKIVHKALAEAVPNA